MNSLLSVLLQYLEFHLSQTISFQGGIIVRLYDFYSLVNSLLSVLLQYLEFHLSQTTSYHGENKQFTIYKSDIMTTSTKNLKQLYVLQQLISALLTLATV